MSKGFDLKFKIECIDRVKELGQVKRASEEKGVSRRSLHKWVGMEDQIRLEYKMQLKDKRAKELVVPELAESMGIVEQYKKRWKDQLDQIDGLESRKKVLVGALEKVLWDHMDRLDQDVVDLRPDLRTKVMKDLIEIREKLSEEPEVIQKVRDEMRVQVLQVLERMIPERVGEFISQIEEIEFEEVA